MLQFPSAFTLSRSTWVAAGGFVASLLVLGALAKNEPSVVAAGNQNQVDLDMDGLSDAYEQMLGTQPNQSDSDGDGYTDLEENARSSDPLDILSLPDPAEFGMALGAYQEGGMVTVLATLYSDASKVGAVRLDLGVVYQGQILRITPRSFGTPRAFRVQAHNPLDRLTVVQIPLPVALVRRVGQVNLVSMLRDTTPGGLEPVIGVLPLVNFSGITMAVEQTPATMTITGGGGRPAGIIYRPLAGGGQLPSTWSGGEVCFQRTAPVGVSGVSIVHEVEAAGCTPMDTYCSSSNCSAGVGRSIDIPDPAALAGG